MGNESSRERIIGLMGAIVGSMVAMVGAMGGDVVGSMMRAVVGLMGAVGSLGALRSMGNADRWRWPGGLMESSRERIIG